MKYRRLYFVSLLIVVILVGGMTLINYIADPYGAFRRDFSYQFLEPDRLFNKARYIGKNPDKYDCFIFGSSRVNGLDVTKIKDATCYNMTYPLGLPGNHLENIKYFLKKGVKIKLLIMGVDEFSFKYSAKMYVASTMGGPYPPVIGEKALPVYLKYLVTTYRTRIWQTMLKGYSDRKRGLPSPVGVYDQWVTGHTFNPPKERSIEEHPDKHSKLPSFRDPTPWDERGVVGKPEGEKYLPGTLKDLREIVSLAKEHNIRLIVLVNPIHAIKFHLNDRSFAEFKREMASITDFYDFSGWNSVNTNPYYYYEPNHYRFVGGNLILARIFNYNPPVVPADFGILVTRSNVDQHLADLEKQAVREMKERKGN
jgi:hypothetical protein